MSATSSAGPVDARGSPHATLTTLAVHDVTIAGGFWAARQAVNRDAALPHGIRMLEAAGNLDNLKLAAGKMTGRYRGPVFMDSDVYKWLDAAACEMARVPSAALASASAEMIDLVAAAQGADGYVNSYYQVAEPGKRWTDFAHGHELYCAGHLFQAAVAHHRATGEDRLLTIARRFGDYLVSVFGPGRRTATPGHPEIEMALIELSRETGERRYLELATFFIDQRGRGWLGGGRFNSSAYFQDRVPVRDASVVEGHAVRALYLTTGLTDLYLETGDAALLAALNRQWHDLVAGKLYVTGGVGARHNAESFGQPFELPNDLAYCETCGAIASVMWSWRMLLATGHARYADLIERTLYNAILAGVSLSGDRYFYVNPLASNGEPGRLPPQRVASGRVLPAERHAPARFDRPLPRHARPGGCPDSPVRVGSDRHRARAGPGRRAEDRERLPVGRPRTARRRRGELASVDAQPARARVVRRRERARQRPGGRAGA